MFYGDNRHPTSAATPASSGWRANPFTVLNCPSTPISVTLHRRPPGHSQKLTPVIHRPDKRPQVSTSTHPAHDSRLLCPQASTILIRPPRSQSSALLAGIHNPPHPSTPAHGRPLSARRRAGRCRCRHSRDVSTSRRSATRPRRRPCLAWTTCRSPMTSCRRTTRSSRRGEINVTGLGSDFG